MDEDKAEDEITQKQEQIDISCRTFVWAALSFR